jgi:heme exporter protein C
MMRLLVLAISLCLTVASGWLALTVAAHQAPEYDIVYIHVPAAIASLVCFTVLFVCSILYLRTGARKWDSVAAACGEVGLIFATTMNLTGMIFAKSTWGPFWTPSLRLISSAMLWFLYAAYLILRAAFTSEQRRERLCAVFGIIAFIDVPLVYISARFVPDMHRPSVEFQSAWQGLALGLGVSGALALTAALIWIRAGIAGLQSRLDRLD